MNDKMIEEMAKIIDDRLIEANNYLGSMNKGKGYWIAQKLVEHYQCKVPDGSVVLSKEEKQKLLKEMYEQGKFDALADLEKDGKVVLSKEEYDLIDHNIKHLETVCNAHEEEIDNLEKLLDAKCDRCIESDRKETAKEILQSLLDFVNCEKINQEHSFEKIKETLIKVAKTYEVEVEE